MKVLDLFSGIGGFSLGLERAGMETVAFCEIEPFCQKVLKKHWPDVPIYEDVRTLDYDGTVDLICGGYPCQPFSTAGKRQGAQDDRHLWPAMFDLIKKHRPRWVIGENVAGHITMGLDEVLADLEGEGYACQPFIIPACAVDAIHRRDRVWVLAHTARGDDRGRPAKLCQKDGRQGRTLRAESGRSGEDVADTSCDRRSAGRGADGKHDGSVPDANSEHSGTGDVANAERQRCNEMEQPVAGRTERKGAAVQAEYSCFATGRARWEAEPAVGRVADGISNRVDRLRALGNAVVPQVVEVIGRMIMEVENNV